MAKLSAANQVNNVIFGCEGLTLSDAEKSFFHEVSPTGFIFFKRNIQTPDQFAALVAQCREIVAGRPALFLIDQEGGRVQRMQPPFWRAFPPLGSFGQVYESEPDLKELVVEGLGLNIQRLAVDLRLMGLNVNCLPLLDVPVQGSDDIIGDRAFSTKLETIITLGKVVCDSLLAEGVLPVIKHIPGHGRGTVDSHKALPVVETSYDELKKTDFKAFQPFSNQLLAMTAHITFSHIDASEPATFSKPMVDQVIRGDIGFNGLLMSDDLSMGALSGSFVERGQKTIEAGVDLLLHCNGNMDEMQQLAKATTPLNESQWAKLEVDAGSLSESFSDHQQLEDKYDKVMKKLRKAMKAKG